MSLFNVSGFRRMLLGEPEPDMSDPKVRERYGRCVDAGRRFALRTGIARAGSAYVRFADAHRRGVFAVMFAVMSFFTLALVWQFVSGIAATDAGRASGSAVARQDSVVRSLLQEKYHNIKAYEQD